MDFDFTTKAGFQKAIITIVGILATVLISTFGWSPDKANVLVTLLTQFAPIIATVLYYVVNQIAASGKAAATATNNAIKADLVKTLAVSQPAVALAMVTGDIEPAPIPTAPRVEVAPVSFVKDKIEVMKKIIWTDQGLEDTLLNLVGDRIKEQTARFKQQNPAIGDDEAVGLVIKQYVGIVLDEKQCNAANAVIGLPAVIASYADYNIEKAWVASWKTGNFNNALYQVEWKRRNLLKAISLRIVEEAGSRVKNQSLPIEERKSALLEFGIDQYHVDKSDFAIAGVAVWNQPLDANGNLVHGGTLVAFDQYGLVGLQV